MKRVWRTCAIAGAAALVMAACGGSSAKADPAKDLATAKAATLTATDLPGYTATPDTSSSDDTPAALKTQFANCSHEPKSFFADTPGEQKGHSPDFKKGNTTVSAEVDVEPTRSDVDTEWKEISKSGIETCLGQLFTAVFKSSASGVTVGKATATRFTVGVGSRSVGYAMKITAAEGGQSIDAYIDLLVAARDRAGVELDAVSVGQPFDRATEKKLVQTMYNRVGSKAS
ncbi:MAG TPA: hypothetical protein VGO03_02380 [Acidimicrobiia bacterium]|jgi:hypothetical protein